VDDLGKQNAKIVVIKNMDHLLKEYKGEKTALNLLKQYKKEATAPNSNTVESGTKRLVNRTIFMRVSLFSKINAGD
jgi:tRNA isopentenyl-2-thiomethyl-A-37 hydroxylase MiaE